VASGLQTGATLEVKFTLSLTMGVCLMH
jgi:hypothetical protein